MANSLVGATAVKRYDKMFKNGADNKYPALDLVRLEKWYFGGKRGRTLDYGFGTGANLIHLLECGYEVDGIDVIVDAKRLVERKLAQKPDIRRRVMLTLIDTETECLPYDDAVFDYVVCLSVLSLLESREMVDRLLQEFVRVMKPNAKMIVDINGPTSEFARNGKSIGGDVYEYLGGIDEPMLCYCPGEGTFRALLKPFIVDDVGFRGYKYLGNEIFEYIACVRKP